jgi:hypothetical protein
MAGTRRTTARVMVILLGILASLLAPAAARAASETPFRAELTGQAVFTPTSTPGVLANTVTGEGLASHLGRVEVSITEIIDLRSGAVVQRDGRMTMTAANGDALHWSYSGAGTAPDAVGNVTFSGTYTVTGGSGRFADATGGGTYTGVGNVVSGRASVSYTGTLLH